MEIVNNNLNENKAEMIYLNSWLNAECGWFH